MDLLERGLVATDGYLGEDDEELFGVLSIVEEDLVGYLVKSTTIEVDGEEQEFAQICSVDFFCPLVLIVPIEQFEPLCEQYGLAYQHLDELYEEHFEQVEPNHEVPIWDRLQIARHLHQQVLATYHGNKTEDERADFASICALALNFQLIEETVEHRFKHMDLYFATFSHLGVFNPPTLEEIEEFFNPPEEED